MKKWMWISGLMAMLAAQGGCSDDGSSDGDGNGNGGTENEGENESGLKINLVLGLTLTDFPAIGEGAVTGTFSLENSSGSATVTVNGVEITGTDDMYTVDSSTPEIPDAAPGGTLTVTAVDGDETAELILDCPDEVSFTGPEENSTFSVGDSITVEWDGSIGPYDNLFGPGLTLLGNSKGDGEGDHPMSLGFPEEGVNHVELEAGDTSAVITPSDTSYSDYLIHLEVPGDAVDSDDGNGHCQLRRVLHLSVAE